MALQSPQSQNLDQRHLVRMFSNFFQTISKMRLQLLTLTVLVALVAFIEARPQIVVSFGGREGGGFGGFRGGGFGGEGFRGGGFGGEGFRGGGFGGEGFRGGGFGGEGFRGGGFGGEGFRGGFGGEGRESGINLGRLIGGLLG